MAKDKKVEAEYKEEKLRRTKIRKKKRKLLGIEKKERNKRFCRGCGEDPYCYCGDGTPYSY
jgi:hypothetical protein